MTVTLFLMLAAALGPAPAPAVRPDGALLAARMLAADSAMPTPQAGARAVHSWAEGAAYRLATAPGQVSDIALEPGEALVSVAAGDTARWVIGDTVSGSGADRRAHVLVKPTAAGLRTNLLIATDRRTYTVLLSSSERAAVTGLSWTYPRDALLALKGGDAEAAGQAFTPEALDFQYRIEGARPAWRPLRAFDDGRQVFIEFPETLPRGEAPPLVLIGTGGRAELVNYRVRGRFYVVDRLFEAAELRLGEKRQQVVRIVRTRPRRWGWPS